MKKSSGINSAAVALILALTACNNDPRPEVEAPTPRASRTIASTLLSPEGKLLQLQAPSPSEVIAGNDMAPLDLLAKVNVTGVQSSFQTDVTRLQKVNENFFVINTINGESWYFDFSGTATSGANLIKHTPPVLSSAVSEVIALYNGGFWMIGPSTIGVRSLSAPDKDEGANTIHFASGLQSAGAKVFKKLYNDDIRLILADDVRINLIERDKDRIFSAEVAIPTDAATQLPFKILAAGVGDQPDQYWFLSNDKLLVLKREDKKFVWYCSKFQLKINGAKPTETNFGVAMTMNLADPKTPKILSGVIGWNQGGFYSQKPQSMVYLEPNVEASFRTEVLPAITRTCVPCHTGFDQFQTLIGKKAEIIGRLSANTMPPATSPQMTAREKSLLLNWLNSIQ